MLKTNFQMILNSVGSQNRYQMGLIIILFFLWMQVVFILLGQSMIYMNPVFSCKIDNQFKPLIEKQACQVMSQCQITNYFTLTSSMQLYCDNESKRNFIQSIYTLGAFIGLIIINLISDTKGRKPSMIISLISLNTGNLAIVIGGSFKIFQLLVLAQILLGIGAFSLITLTYVIISDFCNVQFKPKAIVYVNSAWGTATILLGVIYLLEINWFDYMLWIVSIPCFSLSIIFLFYLLESPQVLINQKDKNSCIQVLRAIASINKKQFDQLEISKNIDESFAETKNKEKINLKILLNIVKEKQNFKHILVLILIYGTANINYYGISYTLQREGLGFGWNNIIAGPVQLASFFYLNFFIPRTPRKLGISFFYTCCSILGLLFLVPEIQSNQIISTILLGLSRICSTVGYTMIICIHIQIFPMKIQSTAAGLIEAIGLFGVFAAPLIVNLAEHIDIDAIALISVFITFCIWPTIFLKQTLPSKKDKKQINDVKSQGFQQSLLESQYDQNDDKISESTTWDSKKLIE